MAPTAAQRALQQHISRFAHRHGYTDGTPPSVEDLGDEVFGLLETKHALYLFSLPKDGKHVDCLALYGESAAVTLLALTKMLGHRSKAVTRG